MASITYDGQSLMIDGRRRWLVAGSIDYARTPRALWRRRIRAAKQAGLNCVGVAPSWSLHERVKGRFDFGGDLDLAGFIKLISAEGMLCILRAGPYIDSSWDMGGLPAWLLEGDAPPLRSPSPGFMEACARWVGALMGEVRDLQVTGRKAGPIALVQIEHQWNCGDDGAGARYLGELARFFRENGVAVPLANCNNLYQHTEGEIDGWSGAEGLFTTLRQLGAVRPEAPRLALDLQLGRVGVWGEPQTARTTPMRALHRLAQTLAGGGQFLIHPFHGGTSFGFQAGRRPEGAAGGFVTTSNDCGAALTETGGRGPMYGAVKRICQFASSFERVLAGIDPSIQPATLDPGSSRCCSAAHCAGAQGSVVFVFADDSPGAKNGVVSLALPDGSTLGVDLRGQPVVWCLIDALLAGRSTLDFTSLSAFALVGRVFVCFGPAGAHGVLSINGSVLEVAVPSGDAPLIAEHEGVIVVVCSEEQIDAAYATDDAVYIGAAGLDDDGRPVAHAGFKSCVRIGAGGVVASVEPVKAGGRPRPVALSEWALARADDYVDGVSERFARIDGPAPLVALGAPYGYGWLRLRIGAGATKRVSAGFHESADRLHAYLGGELIGVVGEGPGASGPTLPLPLRKGENTVTLLVDNLGRWSAGLRLGARKGLFGHVYDVKTVRAGKPALETDTPLDPLAFRSPLWGVHAGDRTDARRITWAIPHRRKTPIIVTIEPPARAGGGGGADAPAGLFRGLLVLNGEVVEALDDAGAPMRIVLGVDRLKRGKNIIQLAVPGDAEAQLKWAASSVSFAEGAASLTEKAEWAFAKWEQPTLGAFRAPAGAEADKGVGRPAWWRCEFNIRDHGVAPLFDARGLTKGQLYLNGRNVGRYFVATRDGEAVPPQQRYYLPEPWLDYSGANELMIFDEHGASPAKCRIVFDAMGPMGG